MELETLLRNKRDEILRIVAEDGGSNVRVFGSVARGQSGPEIIGMRNVLIHQYFGTRLDILWSTVEHDIPVLKQQVRKAIDTLQAASTPNQEQS